MFGLNVQHVWRQSIRYGECRFINARILHNFKAEVTSKSLSFITPFLRKSTIRTTATVPTNMRYEFIQQQEQDQRLLDPIWRRYSGDDAMKLKLQRRSLHTNLFARMALLNNRNWKNTNSTVNMHDKTNIRFNLNDYDIIGFDLDGTLLRYNLQNTIRLEYNSLVKYLVNVKGYSKLLLDKKFDIDFIQKGLILDADRGNIIKLSSSGKILQCTHGTKLLSDQEILCIYGEDREWDLALNFLNDPLSTWNGPQSEKLRALLDYFDFVASLVFAQAIDIIDEQSSTNTEKKTTEKYHVWEDVLSGLVHIYSRENYANGKSEYFHNLRNHTDRYLLRTEHDTIQWLKDLRSSGKALFLLTGSNIDFANLTATYALGTNWKELFDYIICFAKKPGFFILNRPFLNVDTSRLIEVPNSELSLKDNLRIGGVYSRGNWQQLRDSVNNEVIRKNPEQLRCIYVGDNLVQDVYAPSSKGIDTIAVMEEKLEYNTSDYEFATIIQSKFWGSYFEVNETPTIWVDIYKKNSQFAVATVNELAKLSSSLSDNICR